MIVDNVKAGKAPTESYLDGFGWQHISPHSRYNYIRMEEQLRCPLAEMVDDYIGHPKDLTEDNLEEFGTFLAEVLLVLESQKMLIAQEFARVHTLLANQE